MADGFRVELTSLSSISDGIQQAVTGLGASTITPVQGDAVGHESLASALSNFSSRWRPGVQQLTQDGQKFAGELSASALAYQAVEQRIAQALNGTG